MQKKIQIIAFLAGCLAIIAFAIQAGRHHDNCNECRLSFSKTEAESGKFANTWK